MQIIKRLRSFLVSYLVGFLIFPFQIFPPMAYASEGQVIQSEHGASGASAGSESGAFAQDILGTSPASSGLLGVTKGVGQFSDGSPSSHGSEYVSGAYKGAVLIPVSIIGAIPKPGIHHIPTRTNLLKFITLAGGPVEGAKLSELVIKRLKSDDTNDEVHEEIFEIDAEELLTTAGNRGPLLRAGDVVYIPAKRPWVDSNTMQVISVVSALLGVVVTALVVSDRIK